ncbi:MAG: hypothetical protein COV65_06030 [Nitrosopumilales archaeon CG11_big_fil_rev_8_21_14_0_20_33_24]|nr:MAG: hypothetical protein COV65_06030 [Nitrosopumilales archaeon CG11_big_fil_rev_8_21_14_0_20_33_24]PIY89159.1 MAG: hypothetical protein COY74_06610 [Nitrosopumilales archaeon CG_4_10_14_0_8_um_filter_34_8]
MNTDTTNILEKPAAKRGIVSERILRVLLNHPDKKLTKYRISKLAKANISWVIEFLRILEKEKLVDGTKVKDYKGLIMYWHTKRIRPEYREYMIQKPLDLLKDMDLRYALTTYYAENLIQKYLFVSRFDFYISASDVEQWHNHLSAKGLVGKGNVRVLVDDENVFYNSSEREGLKVVSVPQLIIDLLEEGGPGAEAAKMLIKKESEHAISRI